MPSTRDLLVIRENALNRHRDWKQRSLTADLIIQNRWATVWPDLKVTEGDPTIENLYLEALEDKAASAAANSPYVGVAPTRGTRNDRAETDAQKRRRAFVSLMFDSGFDEKQIEWVMDWLMHGAMFGQPWSLPEDPEHPFLIRHDPRFTYPVSHDSHGRLASALSIRSRTVADLRADYPDNERIGMILGSWMERGSPEMLNRDVEELWYYDKEQWGVALVDAHKDQMGSFRYVAPDSVAPQGGVQMEWLIPPHPHKMGGCPIVERRRKTGDSQYRGALDAMIPALKHAHNLTAQLLLDVTRNIFAPMVVTGIENIDQIGPDSILLDDGSGTANIAYPRPGVNFEAMQHAAQQIINARGVGAYPQQRSGEFGASIASAKGVNAVQGQYNTQLGWAQRDLAGFYTDSLMRLANFDEQWCGGALKEIEGFDEGEMFTDKYDPAMFWKGDYRVFVKFRGEGYDRQAFTSQMAMVRNMGGMSLRRFVRDSGMSENPLQEERDMAIETRNMAFQSFLMQQAAAGNMQPLQAFSDLLDDDKETVSSATSKTIKEMFAVPTEGPAGPGGPGGPGMTGNPGDTVLAERSLASGGTPPGVSGDLASLLPPGLGRAVSEQAPGGTAA
ncbi:MAG: hypothetical protein ABIJ75_10830 [Actinomycetota bacterium]